MCKTKSVSLFATLLSMITVTGCASLGNTPTLTCADVRSVYLDSQDGFRKYMIGVRSEKYSGESEWSLASPFSGFDGCKVTAKDDGRESSFKCTARYERGAYRDAKTAYDDLVNTVQGCVKSGTTSKFSDRDSSGSARNTSFELDQGSSSPYATTINVWINLFSRSDGGGTHVWVDISAMKKSVKVRQ